ncbi:MAG: type II toxin-antitoxin system Phd/YefM family antitoxin [Salinibacterium sp.]|nr:type II toxin-antitoxin system Phd/YefM family antitoxin [Salinibacterium sp.]
MSATVNVYEAKSHFSQLLARVEGGEEIVIARHGRPVARLVPLAIRPNRTPGLFAGQIVIADDFDDFTEQDVRDWYGE